MTQTSPHTPGLRVSLLLRRDQLRWRGVARLLEGLTGPLCPGEVILAPDVTTDDPGWLRALMALEGRVFPAHGAEPQVVPVTPEAAAPCDVIVDFGATPPPPELLQKARHGIWQMSCQAAPVAAQVMAGASAFDCALRVHDTGSPTGLPIATARLRSKALISLSHVFATEKTVQLALHNLRKLAITGALPAPVRAPPPAPPPRIAALPRYFANVIAKAIGRRRDNRQNRKPFALRIGQGQLPDIDPTAGTDIPNAPGTYAADPFLFERDGALYCFYEEYVYATGTGRIAVARLTDTGAQPLGPALETPYHLSYPYLFEDGGELYMMPETLQAHRLEVWRCTDFPLGWERHATGPAGLRLADPVLIRHGEGWLLFGNSCHDGFGDYGSELSLYEVGGPGLDGLKPHPLNPVVVGSDTARGGGRIFAHEGRLYRMSQDDSGPHYGYGLNVMEITDLTPSTYAEHRVGHITPDRIAGAIGCHHGDSTAGRWVIDIRWP